MPKPWHKLTPEEKREAVEKWKNAPVKPWFIQVMADSLRDEEDDLEPPGAALAGK